MCLSDKGSSSGLNRKSNTVKGELFCLSTGGDYLAVGQTCCVNISTVCILGALWRQADLQGVFVKIGDSIRFKGFLEEFQENTRSWENQKSPEKSPEK